MRQSGAVDATATGGQTHGRDPQRRARGGAGARPDRWRRRPLGRCRAGATLFRPAQAGQRKLAAVTRLFRGEPLETLARELNVTAARLSAWGTVQRLGDEDVNDMTG